MEKLTFTIDPLVEARKLLSYLKKREENNAYLNAVVGVLEEGLNLVEEKRGTLNDKSQLNTK